jgi:hypothetical protein
MEIKEAMDLVKKEFKKIFGEEISDIRLEEANLTNESAFFNITVSFRMPLEGEGLATVLSGARRVYKKVSVDKKEKKITSISMYNA